MTKALYIDCCIRGEQSRTQNARGGVSSALSAREDV